jgi:hypothetical protein
MEYLLNVVTGVILGWYARTGGHPGYVAVIGLGITVTMSIFALTLRPPWRDSFHLWQKLPNILGLVFVDSVFRAVVIALAASLTYLIFGLMR